MATIDIRSVSKAYGGHAPVLTDIDLSIRDGEFIVLVGPSGCGKSTLLRMIAGLEAISAGTIAIGGRVVNDLAPKARDIAMVFQSYALYPHMTVAENMTYSLRLKKTPRATVAEKLEAASRKLGLDAFLARKPKALSGGQRQRVAMGRAIVRAPKAFLFDEPLSNLDARLREQMRAEIRKLHAGLGATSIYVTHDQVEAMTLADRIVVMHQGVVQQVGSPADLYRTPANLFVAGFIGSPRMNFLKGTVRQPGSLELDHGASLPLAELRQPAGEVVLGVRPDGFAVGDGATAPVRGKVVLDPGYAGIYTYARSADEEIPALEEGQQVALDGAPWLIDKETQPPARLSEAKLVQLMDEQGLGTKATRPDIIQKLYNRRYVRNHPPEPTATGIAMYEAFKEYVPDMATSEMTASLEGEMDEIAEEKMTKDEVVEDSRKLVHKTFKDLLEGEEALSKMIWEGMDRDRILGPCIVCQEAGRTKPDGSPNMLRIIRAKKSGKSFVGCTGWEADNPESCDQTFPMPQPNFYEVTPLEENCSVCHRTPRVNVKTRGRAGRPWKLCFNDDCPTMVEMREKKAERLAAQEAAKKAKEAKEAEEKASGKKKPAKKSSGKKSSKKATTVAARIASPPDLGTRRVRKAGSRKGGSGGASKRKG